MRSFRDPSLRAARSGDYASFARLVLELQNPEPIPSEEAWTSAFCARTIVLEAFYEGIPTVLGYCFFQVLDEGVYVRHLVVDPRARRQGFAKTMMQWIRMQHRDTVRTKWELNAKRDNVAAIAFYESLGMRRTYPLTVLRIEWTMVERVERVEALKRTPCNKVAELSVAVSAAECDSEIEDVLGVVKGLLRATRARRGRSIHCVRRNGVPAAVASFDPHFPGASPFKVRDLFPNEVALLLLESMRSCKASEHSFVQLVVEEDAPLVAWLDSMGAVVLLDLIHLEGLL
jgi:GNAT superfamily N-acetyltransferase